LARGLPEFVSPIILYAGIADSDLSASTSHVKDHLLWIANRLAKLSSQPLVKEESFAKADIERLQFILDAQRRLSNAKIYILQGGYEAFKSEFPLLSGHIKTENMRPLPCAIAPGLFLGSRDSFSYERRKNGQLGLDLETIRQL